MFAILISEENMPKIQEVLDTSVRPLHTVDMYIRHPADWYFIQGYIPYIGAPEPLAILPGYVFETNFEYDPDKIKTDWDQIVRK